MACITDFSVSLSNADEASSKTNISGFLYKALAIPILCLCPPDNFIPLSPTIVSNPFGKESINSFNCDWSTTVLSL